MVYLISLLCSALVSFSFLLSTYDLTSQIHYLRENACICAGVFTFIYTSANFKKRKGVIHLGMALFYVSKRDIF